MNEFEFIKTRYLQVRNALIKYLEKFDEQSYYYQPTEKSNATAWIVPHLAAFERVMIMDHIPGFKFNQFISEEDIEKYKPGADGFALEKKEALSKDEAIKLLRKAQKTTLEFLDLLINNAKEVEKVDRNIAFDKYLLNFTHDTEHYGQIKYLLGTFKRTQ